MKYILDLEKLKTDRLMSLVRRLVIQSDYKILVTKGAWIWFLNNYIHPQAVKNNLLNRAFLSLDLDGGSGLMIARSWLNYF